MLKIVCITALFLLWSGCSSTTSEREPNNTFGSAQRITTVATVSGTISSARDRDCYKFVIYGRKWSDMHLSLELEHAAKSDLLFDIFRDGKRVVRVDQFSAKKGSGSRKPMPDNKITKERFANLTLEAGTYTIVVRKAPFSRGVFPVDYTLRLKRDNTGGFSEVEPNNSFKYANRIEVGGDILGFISPGSDPLAKGLIEADWYKLEVNSTNKGLLDIEVSGVPGVDLTISVYDANRKLLRRSNSYKEHLGEKITKMAVKPQAVYYIKVASAHPFVANHTMPYTLRTMLTEYRSGFEMEPNDVIKKANAIKVTEPVSGYLSQVGDVDYYKFELPKAGNFMFSARVKGVPDVDLAVALYNSSGVLLKKFNSAGSGEAEYVVNFGLRASSDNQTFYIAVISKSGSNNREEYRMVMRVLEASMQGEFESNDGIGQANPLTLNVQKMGFLFPQSDVDYFSFKLATSRHVQVYLRGVSAIRFQLALVSKDGKVIKQVKQKKARGALVIEQDLYTPATYYVRVKALGGGHGNAREPYYVIVKEGAPLSSSSSAASTTVTNSN